MLEMNVTWYRPAEYLPENCACVLGAMSGHYPNGEPFRVVLPMFFFEEFFDEDTQELYENCFIDDDEVKRFPIPIDDYEVIDFWMPLPPYPVAD